MNRRECFVLPLILAGCGGDVEYTIQPSPTRAGNQLHSDVPGYAKFTWTPSVGGNATYVTQEGYGEKIGNIVGLHCFLQINQIGTGSVRNISGVPMFDAKRVIGTFAVGEWNTLANPFVFVSGQMAGDVVGLVGQITLFSTAAGATSLGLNTVLGNGSYIYLTGIYNLL